MYTVINEWIRLEVFTRNQLHFVGLPFVSQALVSQSFIDKHTSSHFSTQSSHYLDLILKSYYFLTLHPVGSLIQTDTLCFIKLLGFLDLSPQFIVLVFLVLEGIYTPS